LKSSSKIEGQVVINPLAHQDPLYGDIGADPVKV